MIGICNIRATTFDLDRIDLWWEVKDTDEDVQDYDLYLLRAGSPLGPYYTVAGPMVNRFYLRDTQVSLLRQWRDLHYRIKAVHRQTGEEREFPEDSSVTLGSVPTLDALEVRRLDFVLFREKIGRVAWLYKRRQFGTRCPNCYVQHGGRRTVSKCATCYGTSYAGGYWSPVELLIQKDPTSKSEQHMDTIKTQQQNTTARCPWFPPLDPGDVIVMANNERWRVYTATPTERLGVTLHQELQLHAITPGDIEYALPVNVEEGTIQETPPREHTNPHNPGEVGDLRPLLDLYGISS